MKKTIILIPFFSIVNQEHQPNLNYFNTKTDWEEYLSRSPDEFERWLHGNNQEIAGFEVAELIKISQNCKVIVDTNIPIQLLKEIADYHQIVIMLSQPGIAVANFFDRADPEKLFLKKQIANSSDSDRVMASFRACIERVNSQKYFDKFINSGCFVIIRESIGIDNREQVLAKMLLTSNFRDPLTMFYIHIDRYIKRRALGSPFVGSHILF